MIAFIQVRDTAWEAFKALDDETLASQNEDAARLRRNGQLVSGEGAGKFWDGTIGFTVVNCIGTEAQLDSFYNYFPPTDTLGYWKWGFDGKVDFATEYSGQHDDILFLHKDHIEYDENGNPISSTPATFDNPNWANDYAGSDQNYFARSVSRGMGEGFG